MKVLNTFSKIRIIVIPFTEKMVPMASVEQIKDVDYDKQKYRELLIEATSGF